MKNVVFALILALSGSVAVAKIPAPQLTDEAKAKAAEAAAKTAWSSKVDGFQLCRAQDRAAAHAAKTAKAAGKDVKAAKEAPPCVDPGAFVYVPAPAAAAPSPAAAASTPAKKS